MPKRNQKAVPEAIISRWGFPRGQFRPRKPSNWLERAFIYMAFLVALVATFALLFWSLITFVVPFNVYTKQTAQVVLSNGQLLQVQYPNLVLAEDTPVYITLILYGKSNTANAAAFIVEIPPGLTVVQPMNQAYSENLKLIAPTIGSDVEPTQIRIGLQNSRSVGGISLLTRQPVVITSGLLQNAQTIDIGVETIPWFATRAIINSTINERSALILLITGFLSGTGALILQYMKTQQDRAREDRQNKEHQFRDQLEKNPLDALNRFVNLDRDNREGSDFSIYRPQVDLYSWEYRLQQLVLEKLEAKDHFEAKRAAEVLGKLCDFFGDVHASDSSSKFEHSMSLTQFCELASIDDPKEYQLTPESAQCLLNVSKRWQNLKPIVTTLIQDFSRLPENLPIINEKLAPERKGQLLRDANIQKIIDDHINKLRANREVDPVILTAAEQINDLLVSDIRWRDIRSRKERALSDKVQRWLSGCTFESIDANFSLGSEYAELDNQLKEPEIEHPVFKQINHPSPMIVFGDEGMGKTVAALWLVEQHRKSTTSGVFSIYAPFEFGVDLTQWIVEKIARALINFTADNPQKFITASDSHKVAMGRLMFWHAQNMETLRLNLYSSPSNNDFSDIEQVLDHVKRFAPKKFTPKRSTTKPSKDEMLSLLDLARPEVFDQIYFVWDVRSSSPQEDVARQIREMVGIADHLERQNVFIKIFAPLTAKQLSGKLGVIRSANNDLIWSEAQLRQLVEKKIDKFEALWDKSVEDPVGMIVEAAERSPRHLIKLLLRLMDYVDDHVQEEEHLKKSDFEQVRLALAEKK